MKNDRPKLPTDGFACLHVDLGRLRLSKCLDKVGVQPFRFSVISESEAVVGRIRIWMGNGASHPCLKLWRANKGPLRNAAGEEQHDRENEAVHEKIGAVHDRGLTCYWFEVF